MKTQGLQHAPEVNAVQLVEHVLQHLRRVERRQRIRLHHLAQLVLRVDWQDMLAIMEALRRASPAWT